jgi:hypothetical protein
VAKKEDRKQGGFFLRLKTDEWLKAYALFSPNPEEDGNSGWYEYFEHYDKSNNQYVPCLGDDCYMCELGENPSTRALTLWYFPDNPEKEQLKVFKMNGYLIRDFTEIDEEEGGVLGRKFRIKRLSDKGEYRASVQQDKPLLKKEISRLLKLAVENGIEFEGMVLKQAKAAYDKQSAVDALTEEDDDDDDEDDDEDEETPKARKGKAATKAKAEPEDEDDDEDEEEEDEEDDEEEDENDEDDEDEEEEDEEEDDEDEEDEDEDDEDDEEESEDSEIDAETFTVVSTSEADETVTVKIDGKNTKLWVGEGVDVDFDAVKKGVEITVSALQDAEGDWVLTSLKVKRARRAAAKK